MNEELLKVSKLFENDGDLKALELLYKITNDELVNILIKWYNEYEEIPNGEETNEFYMYDDIIHHIYIKYGL